MHFSSLVKRDDLRIQRGTCIEILWLVACGFCFICCVERVIEGEVKL